ncbi:MAG TPA: hypothetical protein VGC32_18180 [Solirubrobacterales bacterium]
MAVHDPELDVAARALVDHDVRFVVVDGFAVIANRFIRATEDIDFLVPDDPDNDRRMVAALRSLDARRLRDEAPVSDDHLLGQAHLRVATNAGIVDVLRGGVRSTSRRFGRARWPPITQAPGSGSQDFAASSTSSGAPTVLGIATT